MSALTLASQDFAGSVAGPMAFSARRNAPETAGGEKAGDTFDAVLAQSKNDAPMAAATDADGVSPITSASPAPETDATPAAAAEPRDFARDGALWRDLSAVSGVNSASAPSAAAFATPRPAAAVRDAQAKMPDPDAIAKSLGSAGVASTPPAAGEDEIASARGIDRKAPVPLLSRASGTIPSTPATPTEKASPASRKTPAAQEAEPAATSVEPKAPTPAPTPTPAVDPLAASSLSPQAAPAKAGVSSQTGDEASASRAGAAETDSVARIGAALASASRRATASGGAEKSGTQADSPLAASDPAATSPVHVVAQQTWLPPVSPAFSPGLNRQAAADRAALEAPRAARAAAAGPSIPEAPAAVADAAPAAGVKTEPPVSIGFAVSGGPAGLANDDSDSATPAVKKPADAPAPPGAAPLAATPRRDLEITLAPRDLGGLAVRMKSAGDRLEIAFVADKGETARMISDKSATLASQLHGAGLGLGGIDINAASRMEAGASAHGASADSRENTQDTPHRQDSFGRGRQDQSHETGEKTSEPRASNGDRGLYL